MNIQPNSLTARHGAAIVERVKAGESFGLIAKDYGISRNTIAGMIYRARRRGEDIPLDTTKARKSLTPPPAKKRQPKPAAQVLPPQPPYEHVGVAFLDVKEHHCRWPLWGKTTPFVDKLFCGVETPAGQPYCDHCRRLSVAPKHTSDTDRRLNFKRLVKLP